jgi:hypothetical protein
MTCKRIQKLAPLYCSGELSERAMIAIAAHTERCDRCSAALAEFRSARKWLSAYELPELSDEFFLRIRGDVHRQIRAVANEGPLSWRNTLTASWRSSIGVAATFLVVLGVLAAFRHGPPAQRNPPPGHRSEQSTEIDNGPGLYLPSYNGTPGAIELSRHKQHPAAHRNLFARAARNAPGPDQPQPETIASGIDEYLAHEQESKIRIEFQTEDPHIRIIWLTLRYGADQTGSTDESLKQESEEETGETDDN